MTVCQLNGHDKRFNDSVAEIMVYLKDAVAHVQLVESNKIF